MTSPGGREVAGRRGHDAALALSTGSRKTAAVHVADRGQQGRRVAVRHEGDAARQRLERRPLRRLAGQRERAHRAAVEAALGGDHRRRGRCAGRA